MPQFLESLNAVVSDLNDLNHRVAYLSDDWDQIAANIAAIGTSDAIDAFNITRRALKEAMCAEVDVVIANLDTVKREIGER
jgi:hypothetical protein